MPPWRTPRGAQLALPLSLRTRLRGLGAGVARRLRSTTYLRKWLVLGVALGVIAGLGAVAFYSALVLADHFFLGFLAGFQVPTPAGEGFRAGSSGFVRPWVVPLVVGLGGLISGVLVFALAPEAQGHGTDAAIAAVHDNPRGVRVRAVVVKILASAITIGSGGSGGREGPTAQISAGFGSLLARVLDLSPADGRIAVSVGIGSGIGSIFGAPLGGALLSAEILYRDDFEVDALIPSIIASVVGYTTFSAFEGFRPLFGFAASGYHFGDPLQLVWYALIGIVAGFVGLGYAKVFYGVADLFERLPTPRVLRPAIGGLMVGAIAIALPEVLGTGYGWVQKALGHQLLSLPLWVVLALPLAKILATSFSIGSGGSGGIFGPGIFIGAFSGAAVWRLLAPIAPGIPHSPAPFVIVGMMACFGAIARAPLAVMLMVAEMTGSVTALTPALIAVGLATLIVQRSGDTIYRSQLRSRDDSPARRLRTSMPLLGTLGVTEFMTPPRVVFDARNGVDEASGKLTRDGLPGAPVVDEREAFIGVVVRDRLSEVAGGEDIDVGRLVDPTVPTATVGDHLGSALEALLASDANWIPVLDEERRVVGILSISGVVRGYRAGLQSNLRQISQLAGGTAVVDLEIGDASGLIGRRLRDAGLPAGTIVMTLQRGAELILPRGDTALEPGDRVGVLTHAADADQVRLLIEGSGDGPGPWPDRPSGGS